MDLRRLTGAWKPTAPMAAAAGAAIAVSRCSLARVVPFVAQTRISSVSARIRSAPVSRTIES